MAEYIERSEAEKVASRYGCTNGSALGVHSGLADCIAYEILKLPPADVAPVRHGRWVLRHKRVGGFRRYTGLDEMGEQHTIIVDERAEHDDLYCSECGRQSADNWLNYCPNCGAKMDGGQDDG